MSSSLRSRFAQATSLATLALLGLAQGAAASTLLAEDFEGSTLDPRISLVTVGAFGVAPGLRAMTEFGSTQAWGFGRSVCGVNCFDGFVSGLLIDFGTPTFVSQLSFNEMELFGNWGSGGAIFIDGALWGSTHYDYGRLPYNDLVADTSFRAQTFVIDRELTTLELRVRDITNASEIRLDDLVLSAVPEAPPQALWLAGLAVLGFLARVRRTQEN